MSTGDDAPTREKTPAGKPAEPGASASEKTTSATKAAQMKLLGDGLPTAAQVEAVLKDWDGKDLLEGIQMLSDSYPARSLKDSLMLTELVEDYRKHGMGHRTRG